MRPLAGQRFSRLVALEPTADRTSGGRVVWRCRCDCGAEALVSSQSLLRGATQSCGCLLRETGRRHLRKARAVRRLRCLQNHVYDYEAND